MSLLRQMWWHLVGACVLGAGRRINVVGVRLVRLVSDVGLLRLVRKALTGVGSALEWCRLMMCYLCDVSRRFVCALMLL